MRRASTAPRVPNSERVRQKTSGKQSTRMHDAMARHARLVSTTPLVLALIFATNGERVRWPVVQDIASPIRATMQGHAHTSRAFRIRNASDSRRRSVRARAATRRLRSSGSRVARRISRRLRGVTTHRHYGHAILRARDARECRRPCRLLAPHRWRRRRARATRRAPRHGRRAAWHGYACPSHGVPRPMVRMLARSERAASVPPSPTLCHLARRRADPTSKRSGSRCPPLIPNSERFRIRRWRPAILRPGGMLPCRPDRGCQDATARAARVAVATSRAA